jgi:hypothetical protein
VGVNDIHAADNIRISPNPVSGQFSIFNIPAGIDKVEFFNISGMIIYTEATQGNTYLGNTSKTHLEPGVYFVQLSGKGKKYALKLVVK